MSSEFSDGFAAANAIDDSGTTEWSSGGDDDDAFITIDLGDERDIAGGEFITRSMLDGTAITETFTVTIDDGEIFGPFPAGTAAEPTSPQWKRRVGSSGSTSTRRPVATWERSRVRVLAP